MTCDTRQQDCKECGAKLSIQTKIFSYKGRINEVWTESCNECGELTTRQQDLVNEAEDNREPHDLNK